MEKTKVLHLRISPQDFKKIERAADRAHLAVGTWARQMLLTAVDAGKRPWRATKKAPRKKSG
jgi:hypothetical protein